MDDEMNPMMEGMDMEEKPEEMMMMEDAESEDEVKQKLQDGGFMICCCLCQCSDAKTKDLTCCCFFPIRCGVLFIGAFIIAVTLFVFLEIFYQLLNDDIHWWYVFVGVILAACLIVASAFAIIFFTKDTETSRSLLFTGCLLTIVGVSLVAVWSTIYFVFLYKKDNVTTGNDGVGFMKATRKQEVVITLYVACCIDALFAYFICIVTSYQKAMEEPKEEDVKAMSEKAMSEKAKSEKMDEMMAEDM
jgi:hypothetical protein